MSHDAYFFGCWQDIGHYLWLPGMHRTKLPAQWGPDTWKVDGGFVPKEPGVVGITWTAKWLPSVCTILSMIDNTVDSRPGSHATFVFVGEKHNGLPLVTVAALAAWHFPEVAARIGLRKAVEDTLR